MKARRYTHSLNWISEGVTIHENSISQNARGNIGLALEVHYEPKEKKGLKSPQCSKKKRVRKTCLNLLRLSKKELKSDLIKVCRYLHKEEISDNK